MGKCWQLLSWDIPLKLMRLNAEGKAKAVVIEPKEHYVTPKTKMQCSRIINGQSCRGGLIPHCYTIELYDNWEHDGTFRMDVSCSKCGWVGYAGCVVVEVQR